MDPIGLLFILLFCILGALIAWGADTLGRNIGKKRRSLFGLRPRHTAAFLTAVAGFLLPLCTALLLFGLSKDVRTWMIEGRKAVQERDRSLQELQKAKADLSDAEIQVEAQRGVVKDLASQRSKAVNELQQTKAEAQELEKSVGELRRRRNEAEATARAAKARLDRAARNLQTVQGQLGTLRPEFQRVKQDYATALKQFNEANEQTARITFDLNQAESELKTRQDRINSLSDREAALTRQVNDLKAQFDRDIELKTQEIDQVNRQLESGRLRLDQAQAELSRTVQLSQQFAQGLDQNLRITRTRSLSWVVGEEMTRLSLGPNLTQAQAEAALAAVLRTARTRATDRGARAPQEGAPVAGLTDLPLDDRRVLTAQEQERRILAEIKSQDRALAITANSLWNVFEGEFAPLRLTVWENPVVFQQSEKVAEAILDGTLDEEGSVREITRFLTTQVREAAIQKKMIPATGTGTEFGSLSTGELLDFVRELRATRRQVRVVALAAGQTRAADPLRLEFRFR